MKPIAIGLRQFASTVSKSGARNFVIAIAFAGLASAQSPIDSAYLKKYEARAVEVTGTVTRTGESSPWALEKDEKVQVNQVITTGRDGFGRFTVDGGSEFSLFSNSKAGFRSNTATAGDLLDVISGRVRVKLHPTNGQIQQRVFTSIATISATHPALISIAIDEDQNVRLDVLEGEVSVQHRLLPRNEPTLVRAVDAILIERNQQLSRRMDRGTLYRYTVKPLNDLWKAVTPKSRSGEPIEGNKFMQAEVRTAF